MRIGTTPTHIFSIPFNTDAIRECQIVYHQNGKEVLAKYSEDCVMSGRAISVTLTQEESFLFNGALNVEIQVRVATHNEEVFASDIVCVRCERCLSDEVL